MEKITATVAQFVGFLSSHNIEWVDQTDEEHCPEDNFYVEAGDKDFCIGQDNRREEYVSSVGLPGKDCKEIVQLVNEIFSTDGTLNEHNVLILELPNGVQVRVEDGWTGTSRPKSVSFSSTFTVTED